MSRMRSVRPNASKMEKLALCKLGHLEDGDPVELGQGDTGYITAGRIHDASYLEDCKLVYVHDRAFGFTAEEG